MAKAAKKPEHKPSKKVALDEVLASLQDLVQNEFADENATQNSESPEPVETSPSPNVLASGSPKKRKRGRPPKNGAEKRPEPAKKSVKSVQPEPSIQVGADDYTYSQEQADLFGEAPTSKNTQKPATRKLAGKSIKPVLETDQNQSNLRVVDNKKSANNREENTPQMARKSSNAAEKPPEQSDTNSGLNWASDIPVLTEVVDATEFDASELQDAVEQSLESGSLSPEARQIAVKVAAKLNIEMRESGGEQLDIKTIMRLQTLLKEALEPKD